MPNADFDAARRAFAQARPDVEPVTFTLCGEMFTALREPMWGDILELWNAPEITDDEARATLALSRFIRSMLRLEDRQRWDDMLFRLPQSEAAMALMAVGAYIAEHMTGFPTTPPVSSPPSQPSLGPDSKQSTGGTATSPKRPRTSARSSRTGSSRAASTRNRNGRSTES